MEFTNYELQLLVDAVRKRKTCYIAGDRMFKEYDALLKKLKENCEGDCSLWKF
jgi:hypothetical protein